MMEKPDPRLSALRPRGACHPFSLCARSVEIAYERSRQNLVRAAGGRVAIAADRAVLFNFRYAH